MTRPHRLIICWRSRREILILALSLACPVVASAGELDADFRVLARPHHSDKMEIQMGRLALEKSQSADMRAFAQMFIDDHAADDVQVAAAAAQVDADLEQILATRRKERLEMRRHRLRVARSGRLDGAALGGAFLQENVVGHERLLRMLDGTSQALDATAMTQVVDALRPKIRAHAHIARELIEDLR